MHADKTSCAVCCSTSDLVSNRPVSTVFVEGVWAADESEDAIVSVPELSALSSLVVMVSHNEVTKEHAKMVAGERMWKTWRMFAMMLGKEVDGQIVEADAVQKYYKSGRSLACFRRGSTTNLRLRQLRLEILEARLDEAVDG